MKHTPTPWKLVRLNTVTIDGKPSHNFSITLGDDRRTKIALLGRRQEINGNFIVTACNAHEELVKALNQDQHEHALGKDKCVWCCAEEALAKAEGRT